MREPLVRKALDAPLDRLAGSWEGFLGLLSHEAAPREAVASGRVRLEGDENALERFVQIFAWPAPATLASG